MQTSSLNKNSGVYGQQWYNITYKYQCMSFECQTIPKNITWGQRAISFPEYSMPVRGLCSGMTLGKSNLFYPK